MSGKDEAGPRNSDTRRRARNGDTEVRAVKADPPKRRRRRSVVVR